MLIYLLWVKPFVNKMNYKTELFNEGCLLILSYHVIVFSDVVDSPEVQYYTGWSMIAITVLNFTVNFGVMLKNGYPEFKEKIIRLIKKTKEIYKKVRVCLRKKDKTVKITEVDSLTLDT